MELYLQEDERFQPGNDHRSMIGWTVLSGLDQYPSIHKQGTHH